MGAGFEPLRPRRGPRYARRAGYSGTMLLSKRKPRAIRTSLGVPEFDAEGRLIINIPTSPGRRLSNRPAAGIGDQIGSEYAVRSCRRFLDC